MLSQKQIESHLQDMENRLIGNGNKKKVDLSNDWKNEFPEKPGVYVAFENRKVVYVGETGNIRGRMNDLRDSRHHSLRRNIGRVEFSTLKGYKNANSKEKFPPHIEKKVDDWLKERIKISVLSTKLGRKELEEKIVQRHSPKYNKKGQRISD